MAAGQVFTGYTQPAIGLGATGKNDGVVGLLQFLHAEVFANINIAEEAEGGRLSDAGIDLYCLLELGMVRGHAAAHQPVGRGQALIHVHGRGQV